MTILIWLKALQLMQWLLNSVTGFGPELCRYSSFLLHLIDPSKTKNPYTIANASRTKKPERKTLRKMLMLFLTRLSSK